MADSMAVKGVGRVEKRLYNKKPPVVKTDSFCG